MSGADAPTSAGASAAAASPGSGAAAADPRRSHGYHPLRVVRIVQETPQARTFVLDPPSDLADVFEYRAGQFLTFRVRVRDEEYLRSYSMSSAPGVDEQLAVTVKRVPGGVVSNWLHDNVEEGDVLEATRPSGVFCVSEDADDRVILAFGAGSGITPLMSIAKRALAQRRRSVRMLYANRDRDSVIFGDSLEQLAAQHGERFELRQHLDEAAGFLSPDEIAAFLEGSPDAEIFICGPTPFMDMAELALRDAGVAQERINLERFINAGQFPESRLEEPPTESASDDAPTDESGTTTVTIILKGAATEIDYHEGDTVLNTARRGGLTAPFSCEAGNCATCMALIREGSATMRVNDALTPEEVEEGWVLTCQAIPTSPTLTVEYESY